MHGAGATTTSTRSRTRTCCASCARRSRSDADRSRHRRRGAEHRTSYLELFFDLAGVALLWWAHFDFLALGAERALTRVPIERRAPVARDIYSFFHFAFVLGIVFFAVAAKKALEHPSDPLSPAGRWALGVGIAVYLLGSVAGRLRAIRAFAWERPAGAAAGAIAVAMLTDLAAVWLLAVAAGILGGVVCVESSRLRELRRGLVSPER